MTDVYVLNAVRAFILIGSFAAAYYLYPKSDRQISLPKKTPEKILQFELAKKAYSPIKDKESLFEKWRMERPKYQYMIVTNDISPKAYLSEAQRTELVEDFKRASMAVSLLCDREVVKNKKRRDLLLRQSEALFPEIKKCKNYYDVAYELYKKKEKADIKIKFEDAFLAAVSIEMAKEKDIQKNSVQCLYLLHKALQLAPEMVTQALDSKAINEMVKTIQDGKYSIKIIPKEEKVSTNTKMINQIKTFQREGRV